MCFLHYRSSFSSWLVNCSCTRIGKVLPDIYNFGLKHLLTYSLWCLCPVRILVHPNPLHLLLISHSIYLYTITPALFPLAVQLFLLSCPISGLLSTDCLCESAVALQFATISRILSHYWLAQSNSLLDDFSQRDFLCRFLHNQTSRWWE